jgi:hypothetical protein
MVKRRNTTTEERIARWWKEGRGQGEGKDYKPWLTIQDVPSNGRSHRVYGQKSGRIYQLLSDVEYGHFLIFEAADSVIDIREQFPLDRDETLKIARELGVRHPRAPGSKTYEVMTSDFVLTLYKDGCRRLKVFAVKKSEDLEERYIRIKEKLVIEKRYWESRGIEWVLTTEKLLPQILVRNIQWLRPAFDVSTFEQATAASAQMLTTKLLISIRQYPEDLPLTKFCQCLDRDDGFELGTYLGMARHLLAHKLLTMDLYRAHPWSAPIATIDSVLSIDETIGILEVSGELR